MSSLQIFRGQNTLGFLQGDHVGDIRRRTLRSNSIPYRLCLIQQLVWRASNLGSNLANDHTEDNETPSLCNKAGPDHLVRATSSHILSCIIVRWYYYFFPGLSKMSSPRNCFFPLARGLWAQFWWLLLHACPQLDLCCQFCPPTECLICIRWSSNQVRHRQGCQRWALASNSWGSAEVSRNQGDIRTDL